MLYGSGNLTIQKETIGKIKRINFAHPKNILFVAGGAFDGIERIIGRRMNTSVIGFSTDSEEKLDTDNLLQYIQIRFPRE